MKKSRGITLIALVVTIIVLLILAGVTIFLVFGQNGIMNRAKEAQESYSEQSAAEKLKLALLNLNTEKITNQQRAMRLEELIEIQGDGISIQINASNKVEIAFDQEKNQSYAIANVDGYRFKVYENSQIELLGKSEVENGELGYVTDGLVVLYDGKNNTGNGHSDQAKVWKNLAPISQENTDGKNDGILNGINQTAESGWTNNSLILDGVDDWVKMSYLHYENMTVEIVVKPLDVEPTKNQYYINNFQNGGIGSYKATSNYNTVQIHTSGEYKPVNSNNSIRIEQTYSLSTRYDGTNLYLNENDNSYQISAAGLSTGPQNSTVFAIGTNPNGNAEDLLSTEARSNIEVYSVRIYNRCLTQEEIQKNYEIDKKRYNLEPIEAQKKIDYVENGLVCLYDGEQNTPYGHSKKTSTWMDLSKNGKDGTLKNVNQTQASGWTNNSLRMDGIDDWVKMSYMHYTNMTIEIVMKPIGVQEGKTEYLLSNLETGGISIIKQNTRNFKSLYLYWRSI